MRRVLLFALMLTSILSFSQIPDSLEVILPWDVVYVESCDQDFGTGPTSDLQSVYISSSEDQYLENAYGDCIKVLRTWSILHWNDGNVYNFIQIVRVDDEQSFSVVENINLHYAELPITIVASELVQDPEPDHVYSFSYTDQNNTQITIDEDQPSENLELSIYDHTNQSVNTIDLNVVGCEAGVLIDVPEVATIEFNGESFFAISEDLLGITVEYPCAEFDVVFTKGSSNKIFSNSIGETVEVKMYISAADGFTYNKTINVIVEGTPPPPIPFYIEEVEFSAGEVVTMDVWTDGIESLIAWQLRLNFENASIIAIDEGEPFDVIPFNIFNEGKTINSLWTPVDALPIDVESNMTWFTLTIETEIDGSTFDVFTTSNDPWSVVGVEDGTTFEEHAADFVFNIAPRDVLNSNKELVNEDLKLTSNLVTNNIEIQGLSDFTSPISINIHSSNGQAIITDRIQNVPDIYQMDITQIVDGIYWISIESDGKVATFKFVKSYK